MKTFYVFLAIIFLTSTAIADVKITGHMLPLETEMLETAIKLDCGISIKEWRGYPVNKGHANTLCDIALDNFKPFLNKRGIKLKHNREIKWSMALLPRGNSYRALNDLKWRFKQRTSQFMIWGYTDNRFRYTFMVGDADHPEFDVTFIHEAFHAMSMWYGVFDSHATTFNDKVAIDESLAMDFTQELGYGK